MNMADRETGWAASLAHLLDEPIPGDLPFTTDKVTFGKVYAQARRMRACLDGRRDQPVCLAAEDRSLLAAALLAALGGGPTLLLPHSRSPQSLAAAGDLGGCPLTPEGGSDGRGAPGE